MYWVWDAVGGDYVDRNELTVSCKGTTHVWNDNLCESRNVCFLLGSGRREAGSGKYESCELRKGSLVLNACEYKTGHKKATKKAYLRHHILNLSPIHTLMQGKRGVEVVFL